ncbi:sugar ABC transporter substrate-binding protein [Pseudarthrobacter sp. AB1]|uniref:ABC transporter substrate-binding protein n=1 Tax=Pseudarthrobacter sp. AB1 TaxID=2138309 RepID=UPI00186BADE2|nr:sugar ABC transporter substrate-binding protein [Pseudarthrobacter sp. AB1]
MRKRILAAATSIVAAMVLGGCSTGATSAKDEPVELTYAMWDTTQEPVFRKMFDEFSKKNPNITVKTQVLAFGDYWTKRQTEASNGTLPDVFWTNPQNFPIYASQGILAPVKEGEGVTADAIPATMRGLYTWNNELYTFPNNRDAIGIWYNKDLFDAAGVKYPADNWTVSDYAATAKSLANSGTQVWGTTAPLDSRATYGATIHNEGGHIINSDATKAEIDSPAAIKGIQFWTDLIAQGSAPTLTQQSETDPISLFLSGKAAMHPDGSWMSRSFADSPLGKAGRIGVAPYPKGSAGTNETSTSSLGNVMPQKAKHPAEALKLVQFLGSKEAAKIYADSGIGLTAYPELDQTFIDHFASTIDVRSFSDAVAKAYPIERSNNTSVWSRKMATDLTPAFEGKTSVADAAAKANNDIQAALDAEKK